MQVSETPILVGRSSHCQIVIDDPSVSSSHAEVVRRGGTVYVRDLNSTNGTSVNGVTVNGEATLVPGSVVQFGLVSYMLSGTDLVEAGAAGGRTQIVGGAPKSTGATTQTTTVPPPPPTTDGSRTLGDTGINPGLGTWTRGLLWGYVALLAFTTLSTVLIFVYFEQYMSAPVGSSSELDAVDSWNNWENVYNVVYIIALILTIPIGILLIVWTHRAHRASDALNPGQRKWGHGWSIGAWFIPIANYILVPLVLSEIHKIASAKRTNGTADQNWPRGKVSAPLIMWFVFYAVGGVTLFIGNAALSDEFATPDAYRGGLIITLIALGITAAASLLAASFIKDISTKLDSPLAANN
jgi:hypothetical protein